MSSNDYSGKSLARASAKQRVLDDAASRLPMEKCDCQAVAESKSAYPSTRDLTLLIYVNFRANF
jgi:hypothetical protein